MAIAIAIPTYNRVVRSMWPGIDMDSSQSAKSGYQQFQNGSEPAFAPDVDFIIPNQHKNVPLLIETDNESFISRDDKIIDDKVAKIARIALMRNFEIAYPVLGDRYGVNATPAGRAASRKVWLDAGRDAAKWLIDRLLIEQHPQMITGIAETITAIGYPSLIVALEELERTEPKLEYAPLIEALSWITPPQQPLLRSRITSIIDRYLASSYIDCQIAALHLTRLLSDHEARIRLDSAMKIAGKYLREEIEDLLDEKFG